MDEREPILIIVDEAAAVEPVIVAPQFQHVERVLTVRQPWAAAMFVHPARA